jgi:hypothetical protein
MSNDEKFERTSYTFTRHHETAKAILVSETGDKDDAFWLPFSQIEILGCDENDETVVILDVPRWLAEKNNLI